MTAKPGRIPCSVPFCRRTAPKLGFADGEQIICGKHWRLGDDKVRRTYTKAKRRGRDRLAYLCWLKVLRQATERAAGISA